MSTKNTNTCENGDDKRWSGIGQSEIRTNFFWLMKYSSFAGFWPFDWKNAETSELHFRWISAPTCGSALVLLTGIAFGILAGRIQETTTYEDKSVQEAVQSKAYQVGVAVTVAAMYLSQLIWCVLNAVKGKEICESWNALAKLWPRIAIGANGKISKWQSQDLILPRNLGIIVLQTIAMILSILANVCAQILGTRNPRSGIDTAKTISLIVYMSFIPFANSICVNILSSMFETWAIGYRRLAKRLAILEKESAPIKILEGEASSIWICKENKPVKALDETRHQREPRNFETDSILEILDAVVGLDGATDKWMGAVQWHLLFSLASLGTPVLFGSFYIYFLGTSSTISNLEERIMSQMSLGIMIVASASSLFRLCSTASFARQQSLILADKLLHLNFSLVHPSIAIQVSTYARKMYSHSGKISPGGFVNIDKGLLTSLLTGSLTYFVILVQLK